MGEPPLHPDVAHLAFLLGAWEGDGVIDVASTAVAVAGSAKPVTHLARRIVVEGDLLTDEVAMAAVGQPLATHLRAALHKV